MAGTVIFGKRSTGRRVRAIWLSTTVAMQTMSTRMGLRTAARVRNMDGSLPRRCRAHGAAFADLFGATEDDGLAGLHAAGDLHDAGRRRPDRDGPLGDLTVRDDPHELLAAHDHQRRQGNDKGVASGAGQPDPRIHAGSQRVVRVVQFDLDLHRPRIRIHSAGDRATVPWNGRLGKAVTAVSALGPRSNAPISASD